jgi:putative PIN family toxin of toxin-antitoxin system
VLDANLWVSRLLVPKGVAGQAVDRALSWGMPLMSKETLSELSEVLSRPKFDQYVSIQARQHFIRLLGGIVQMVPILHRVAICRDAEDDKFLHVALNGEAEIIVTGDTDLLVLHPFHRIDIIAPATFLARTE